jgi:hypothetical protein
MSFLDSKGAFGTPALWLASNSWPISASWYDSLDQARADKLAIIGVYSNLVYVTSLLIIRKLGSTSVFSRRYRLVTKYTIVYDTPLRLAADAIMQFRVGYRIPHVHSP